MRHACSNTQTPCCYCLILKSSLEVNLFRHLVTGGGSRRLVFDVNARRVVLFDQPSINEELGIINAFNPHKLKRLKWSFTLKTHTSYLCDKLYLKLDLFLFNEEKWRIWTCFWCWQLLRWKLHLFNYTVHYQKVFLLTIRRNAAQTESSYVWIHIVGCCTCEYYDVSFQDGARSFRWQAFVHFCLCTTLPCTSLCTHTAHTRRVNGNFYVITWCEHIGNATLSIESIVRCITEKHKIPVLAF